MQPFTRIVGPAAVFLDADVDTDIIYPARFLLVMDREGLGRYLFHDRRAAAGGDFPLDRPQAEGAQVLIAGPNFGCGSSREQAVWALAGAGFRCLIAPSFGEIFYNNCFKNGVLPIRLPVGQVRALAARAEAGAAFEVDLKRRSLACEGIASLPIQVDDGLRRRLLEGLDDIDLILREEGGAIDAFEARRRRTHPWLFEAP